MEINGTKSKKILILSADFYEEISTLLKNGATEFLKKNGYEFDIKSVPGALELPILLQSFSKNMMDLQF